ncbi:MAG: phosphodiester glycosidase family protein [Streptococcaceae bacterium]|nr:phosphodiester glycosidase family protein [Streptococcaceae bacterium]
MERRRKNKKKNWFWIITIVFTTAIIGGGVYALRGLYMPDKSSSMVKINSEYQPKKTSSKNGYVETKGEEAATGSWSLVSDVGTPEWVKVPSKQKLAKFANLSKNGITIYRINNAQVLKTTTNLTDQRMRMAEVIAKYPDSLIMNASAFDMNTGKILGFQVNNGELLNDWSPSGLQYTFVINKNGSCKIYDSSTPASTIIKNGAAQSYDFGTALIRDGKTVPSDGSVNWEIHAFIANDKSNNLYVILSDTNAGYDNIMKGVASLNLENMLLLDSGGSSQLSVNGKTIVASQDNRAVPDYIVMK